MASERRYRKDLKEAYTTEAKMRIYKFNMASRYGQRDMARVFKAVAEYPWNFMGKSTNDKILYDYTRKLNKSMQWMMLVNQYIPVIGGALLYFLTISLKKKSNADFVLYFFTPWAYGNYCLYLSETRKLFEKGFPAHPYIAEKRMKVINKSCFSYP